MPALDFFARQEQAHRNTRWLVVYFFIGVIGLIAAIYVAVAMLGGGIWLHHHSGYGYHPGHYPLWNPRLLGAVALGTLSVIAIGSATKTMELAEGGRAVAAMMISASPGE